MKLAATLAFIIAVLSGCARTVDATAVPEPERPIDCDLIFPGPGAA